MKFVRFIFALIAITVIFGSVWWFVGNIFGQDFNYWNTVRCWFFGLIIVRLVVELGKAMSRAGNTALPMHPPF